MWTYLVILFSSLLLAGVFVRRAHLLHKKANTTAESPGEKCVDDEIEEITSQITEKKTKKDMNKVEELCKKGEERLKAGKEDDAIKF
ncbi:hypothetical protein HON58_03800, partial [Candidatus Peregrinibacteria bacterium]|nr:hypothetical protein [Candidatus Peregrinibacteria bacterium]